MIKCELYISSDKDRWDFLLRLPIVGFFHNYYCCDYKSRKGAIKAGERCAKKFGWIITNVDYKKAMMNNYEGPVVIDREFYTLKDIM